MERGWKRKAKRVSLRLPEDVRRRQKQRRAQKLSARGYTMEANFARAGKKSVARMQIRSGHWQERIIVIVTISRNGT